MRNVEEMGSFVGMWEGRLYARRVLGPNAVVVAGVRIRPEGGAPTGVGDVGGGCGDVGMWGCGDVGMWEARPRAEGVVVARDEGRGTEIRGGGARAWLLPL